MVFVILLLQVFVWQKKSGETSCLVVGKSFSFISDFYQLLFDANCSSCIFLAFVNLKQLQPVENKKNSKAGFVVYKSFLLISNY